MLLRLPTELIPRIAAHLEDEQITVLCGLCRALHQETDVCLSAYGKLLKAGWLAQLGRQPQLLPCPQSLGGAMLARERSALSSPTSPPRLEAFGRLKDAARLVSSTFCQTPHVLDLPHTAAVAKAALSLAYVQDEVPHAMRGCLLKLKPRMTFRYSHDPFVLRQPGGINMDSEERTSSENGDIFVSSDSTGCLCINLSLVRKTSTQAAVSGPEHGELWSFTLYRPGPVPSTPWLFQESDGIAYTKVFDASVWERLCPMLDELSAKGWAQLQDLEADGIMHGYSFWQFARDKEQSVDSDRVGN